MKRLALEYLYEANCLIRQAKELPPGICRDLNFSGPTYKAVSSLQDRLIEGQIYLEEAIKSVKAYRREQISRDILLMIYVIATFVLLTLLHAHVK